MKRVFSMVLASVMVFSMVGCGGNSKTDTKQTEGQATTEDVAENEGQVYNLKFSCTLSQFELENNSAGVAVAHFIDKVETDSEGQIKIQLFKDGTLGKSTDEILE